MSLGILLFGLSSLAGLAGWIWLIVEAFRNQEKNWGIVLTVSLFVPILGPIPGIVFIILRWRIAQRPAYLLIASLAIGILGFAITAMQARQAIAEMAELAEEQVQIPPREAVPTLPDAGGQSSGESARAPRPRPSPPPTPPPPAPSPRQADGIPEAPPPGRPSPTPASAGSLAESKAKAATGGETPTSARDPQEAPVQLKLLRLGEPSPNQLRTLRIQARNLSPKSITELKLSLEYLDAHANRLGRWTTVHLASEPLRGSGATNEFDLQAFFVPQFTHDVRVKIESLAFADGTRWPVLP